MMLLLNSIRNGDLNRLDVEKIIIVIVMGCCFQNFDTFGPVLFVPSFWCRPFFERVPKKERHQLQWHKQHLLFLFLHMITNLSNNKIRSNFSHKFSTFYHKTWYNIKLSFQEIFNSIFCNIFARFRT